MTINVKETKIMKSFDGSITGSADLLGKASPSLLFPFMSRIGRQLLKCEPQELSGKKSRFLRRYFQFGRLLAPTSMAYRQIIEGKRPELSKEPVIWCANHSFKDDVAATIRVARHAYVFFGSLPIFFNTFDGLGIWLNGCVLCNRKLRKSRHHAYQCASRLLEKGTDLILFPEGVWNITPEKIILDLWPGAVRLAQEQRVKIVPIVHYLRDPHRKYQGNVIHTSIGEPLCMDGMTEEEGIILLRDTMASMYYELMDQYGHSTRAELLSEYKTADEAWSAYMDVHTSLKYFDTEIESAADYRSRRIVHPADVWQNVAAIEKLNSGNMAHILYARELLWHEKRRDFQRNFLTDR